MAALQRFPIAAVAIAALASLVGIGGLSGRAHAACTSPGGTTLNCTGDITGDLTNGGLLFDETDGYDTFNVFALTAPVPIDPDDNVSGIDIRFGAGAVGIDLSVTTDAAITAGGIPGYGIYLVNSDGFITLVNTGDISASDRRGISLTSFENLTPGVSGASLTNHGDITANTEGMYADAEEGDVTVLNTGDITSTTSAAIRARATGGNVSVTSDGDLSGTYVMQLDAGGNIDVTLQSGTAYGSALGVAMFGGITNTLDNSATLEGGVFSVYGTTGDDTVNNYGTIIGSVNLGTGTNAFNNLAGGIFRPNATVNLGGGTLTNAGTLSPGDTGTAVVTTVTGNLVQTSTGTYVVDIEEGGATEADRVDASGTASFAGAILPNIIAITSETGQVTIATAAALSSTATVTDVGGYDFSLLVQGGNTLLLSWGAANPADIVGLLTSANANQRAIAIYLDTLNAAGPTAAQQALIDALLALGETDLIAAINQLTPELYSDAQISTLYSSLGFASNLLSCKVNGPGTASIIAEGQCLWAGASATFLSQDTTASQLGFHESTGSFAAGAQVALDDNWRLGFGAGYQSTSVDTVTNATSEGNTGQVGVALKYNVGSALVAGTVSGGRAWYDTTRPVAFTGFSGTAESDSTIDFLNGGLRFAYVFGMPQLYFKPVLDAAVTRIDLGGFTETGGGAANLTVAGSRQTVYTIAPSLEVGTEWWWSNGTLVRPYVRGGATFYSGHDFALNAGFAGAPTGISPFTINTDMDDVMGVVGAGLDMITAEDTALRLSYDGQLGETTQIHAVGVKGSVSF